MLIDKFIGEFDLCVRTLSGSLPATRAVPAVQHNNPAALQLSQLPEADRAESVRLMRVNHVGEVCAQALYQGHAAATHDAQLAQFFRHAAQEERDHLHWTQARIDALGGRTSVLNPLFYVGAFALGFITGKVSDPISLGLMKETEAQVEAHLDDHLQRVPASDVQSRAVLEAMRADEIAHGQSAHARGGVTLPLPIKQAMRAGAKVMTSTSYYV